jgi:aryl-alcohol dehydrogenase-like predicted oxidoreductase
MQTRVTSVALVNLIKTWAGRKRATPAQIALAWLMAQKPWIVPIPGTTVMAHMLENTGATRVRFTPAEITELNSAARAMEIRGQRLPDAVLVFSAVEAPPKK